MLFPTNMIVQVPNVLVTLMTYHGITNKTTYVDRGLGTGEWRTWNEEKHHQVTPGKPKETRLRGRYRCRWTVH